MKPLHDRAKISGQSGSAIQPASPDGIKVVLLSTGVGPPVNLRRYGASTLIEAGGLRLLFDCGRGATIRLAQVGVPHGSISRLFLTHLHSDHEMMRERGLEVDHPTVYRWVQRYAPEINKRIRQHWKMSGASFRVDEACILRREVVQVPLPCRR